MKITLAKALRLKNRMIARYKKLTGLIHSYNSNKKGLTVPISIGTIWADWADLDCQLIELKTRINLLNVEIQEHIYELAECKSRIAFLKTVPTMDGKYENLQRGYSNVAVEAFIEYEAFMPADKVEEMIGENEDRIEWLQDKIDTFNTTTYVEVPDNIKLK